MTTAGSPSASLPNESSAYRRLLTALRVSAWSAASILLVATIGALLLLHRGDAEGSARIAHGEIGFLLQRGETVQLRVPVMQRQWWNYFRVTHGILAATDRRLLFVGVPPEDLLPHELEPPDLEEAAWSYESLLAARRRRVFFNTRAGVTVGSADSRTTFAVVPRNAERLDSLLAIMSRRTEAALAAREAERQATEVTAASARQAVYHLVQRGETLESIAKRYGATVDSLRAWNTLERDRIVAGQRLLVKPAS